MRHDLFTQAMLGHVTQAATLHSGLLGNVTAVCISLPHAAVRSWFAVVTARAALDPVLRSRRTLYSVEGGKNFRG